MNSETFIPMALRTEASALDLAATWLRQVADAQAGRPGINSIRLIHAYTGFATEIHEVEFEIDHSTTAYDNSLLEEVGDVLWFHALASDVLSVQDSPPLSEESLWELHRLFDVPPAPNGASLDTHLSQLRFWVGFFCNHAKPAAFYGRDRTKKGTPLALILSTALERIEVAAKDLLERHTEHTIEDARARVIEKLAKRYPDKFTEQAANERADKAEA
jgi:NTP pyrophosphatase (non-canonical NTP hydrolase)